MRSVLEVARGDSATLEIGSWLVQPDRALIASKYWEDESVANSAAFEDFVATKYRGLVNFAIALTLDLNAAEDATQSALAVCFGRWDRIEHPEAYLRRCIVRIATRRRKELSLDRIWGARPQPRDPIEAIDDRCAILELLAVLPPRQRAVIVLRYLEDLPDPAIGEILGISVGTVKSQTARALTKLREQSLELRSAPS